MSLLYLSDFTKASFSAASDRADLIADQFRIYLENHLTAGDRRPRHSPRIGAAMGRYLDRNRPPGSRHHRNVERHAGQSGPGARDSHHRRSWERSGRHPADAGQRRIGPAPLPAPKISIEIQQRWWAVNLWDLMTRRENYLSTRPVGLQGGKHVLFNITVVIRSVLLKHSVEPALKNLLLAFALSLCVAIFLGAVLPNVILDPLQRVSRNIDLIRTGQFGAGFRRTGANPGSSPTSTPNSACWTSSIEAPNKTPTN